MSEPYHLRCWTRFLASPEEVWQLKNRLETANRECAPLLRMSGGPAETLDDLAGQGLPYSFEARLGLLGALPGPAWPVEITELEPNRRYVDRSSNAWFSEWEHEHLLEPASDATRYVDAVTFTPRVGPARLVRRMVLEFFLHRHRQAARWLPTDRRATAVAVMRAVDLE
jgi:ligand-binding SRPBCC domain-containing protein